MPINRSSLSIVLLVLLTGVCGAVAGWTALYLYLSPNLPAVESIREIKFQTPLRIYSADDHLIGEFGEIRRIPVSYEQTPALLIKAFLAAEDDRFYSHNGVDVRGILRAVSRLLQTGEKQGGGSTITMQVAKNSFPINDGSFIYKAKQIILATKIEKELSKNEILEIYLNQNFLGYRAEGIGAAAQVYYGKSIDQLTLAQWAMIAGLPKAPSTLNPLVNPERAKERRDWILERMYSLEYVSEEDFREAVSTPLTASYHGQQIDLSAPYVAEMVRAEMLTLYGDAAYSEGFKVVTSVDSHLQKVAQQAVIKGLLDYTQRHGYHGPEKKFETSLFDVEEAKSLIDANEPASDNPTTSAFELYAIHATLPQPQASLEPNNNETPEASETPETEAEAEGLGEITEYIDLAPWRKELTDTPSFGGLAPAIVIDARERHIEILVKGAGVMTLPWENGPSSARPYISEDRRGPKPKVATDVINRGDLIRVYFDSEDEPYLAQIPKAQASLVSLDPNNGAIRALVGGFDFSYSNYNRATQANRQPGSNFKPFIYAAALENGFTAATVVNDAPIIKFDSTLEKAWRPENSGGKFSGPIRLREGLYRSKNYVAIRVLDSLGFTQTIRGMDRFGFDKSELPRDLTLALGSHVLTPLQVARGYTVFANGGYKVEPYFIEKIFDSEDNLLFEATPITVCKNCNKEDKALADETLENTNQSTDANTELAENIESPQTIDSQMVSDEELLEAELEAEIANMLNAEGQLIAGEKSEDTHQEHLKQKQLPIAELVMDPRVAYIMDDILKDVIKRGTGTKARSLQRPDIAGKTGTVGSDINNFDAWFSGYNQKIVTTAWIGFDQNLPLGKGEYGSSAALPIWMTFMREALKDIPIETREQPPGLVTVRINAKTGKRAQPNDPDATFEIFREENVPELEPISDVFVPADSTGEVHPDELF
ncbi:penicillin-binding protein 1A [Aurantivibrio plasticivorans]